LKFYWAKACQNRVVHGYRPFIEIKSARCFGLGNAQMEKKWLERYGWNVANQKFTNIKYADDLMLYAQSLYDLKYMTKLLVAHFFAIGLQLNASQKITTRPIHVEIAGEAVEALTRRSKHKYFGRILVGNLTLRTEVEVGHGLQAAGPISQAQTRPNNPPCLIEIATRFFRFSVSYGFVWSDKAAAQQISFAAIGHYPTQDVQNKCGMGSCGFKSLGNKFATDE
jgi:hypothetical protein